MKIAETVEINFTVNNPNTATVDATAVAIKDGNLVALPARHPIMDAQFRYWVDSNGKVRWSRHHTNHGNSKTHPVVPHDHEWYDDDDGNNTENPKWQPPNSGFQAPGSDNDKSTKIVAGVAGTVAVGYVIYVGAKWIIAALAAPATGGGSLIIAGVTP